MSISGGSGRPMAAALPAGVSGSGVGAAAVASGVGLGASEGEGEAEGAGACFVQAVRLKSMATASNSVTSARMVVGQFFIIYSTPYSARNSSKQRPFSMI